MRFSTRLYLLVAFGVAATLGSTTALVIQLRAVARAYDRMLVQEVAQQDRARQMQVAFKTQVQEWKNVLLRGYDAEALNRYATAFVEAETAVRTQADGLVRDAADPETRRLAQQFLEAHREMQVKYAAALEAFRAGAGLDAPAADRLVKGQDRAPTELIDRIVGRLADLVRDKTEPQHAQLAADVRLAIGAALAAAAALFVASIAQSRRLSRLLTEVAGELQTNASHVQAAAEHVSASAHRLSHGSIAQAESMEHTAQSIRGVRAAMDDNGRQAERMMHLVRETDESVGVSTHSLDEMVVAMDAVNESSRQVARIIKSIDEIAFQTNLLALNAAVEAARAGDAGQGFAVVADEVRSLAQRAATAARDTAALIEQSMARVRAVQTRVQDVDGSIRAIAGRVGEVREVADRVRDVARQQAGEVATLATGLSRMGQVTHTTASTAEESAAASEELTAQAEKARELASALLAILGSDERPVQTPRPAVPTPGHTAARAA